MNRWLQDDDFSSALRAAKAAVESISRSMVALANRAVAALDDTLEQSQPAALRLRSAQIVLGNLLTLRKLATIETRLAALEGKVDGEGNS